jgi:glycosyltransferase involved in cell wall biosynthesis
LKVLIVAEYYPRAGDPVLGVWAHRQALAARTAGAEVRVLVLHRPLPPLRALRAGDWRGGAAVLRQPSRVELDGIPVRYVRYLSPPRPWSYASWGRWAAPALARALRQTRREFSFDLIHAHYAVPAGDAVRRVGGGAPLVISVHGHDVQGQRAGGPQVRAALSAADLVLANSAGTARRCLDLGARTAQVVHLGTEIPAQPPAKPATPVLVSVAHLAARKRHADVISALALLRGRHPGLRYVIVGDGPEREPLRELAHSLVVDDLIEFRGQVDPRRALSAAWGSTLFVLPSVEEAFGVAYIEAMAGGVPALGCRGEDGPEEIAACGEGMILVAPRDPASLAAEIEGLLRDPVRLGALGIGARDTVQREFTWQKCGADTLAAYGAALEGRHRNS